MKLILKLFLIFFYTATFSQTNLLDTSTWTVGIGSASGFTRTGTDAENIREMGIDPHGNSVLLWKGITDGTAANDDGGWTSNTAIDPSKTYRCTVWMKKTNSNDGTTYFGLRAKDTSGNWALSSLQDVTATYAYFYNGGVPVLDNWYLFVGYIHDNTFTGTTSIGGIYDGNTGAKILDLTDRKFQSTASKLIIVPMLHRGTPNVADALYLYAPTIYEVNGQEPTIQELIDGADTQAPTAPTLSNGAQTDTTIDLSWTAATDNIAVTGYKVYKDSILETTLGNVLNYQVTGLTAATAYNFTVTALDTAGNESAISNALAITTDAASGGGTGSYWSINNQDVYYNTGNVGIGTNIPDSKLTVKGSIHSEEVKVDLSVPAPDYVFESSYNLTSLEKLQEYIINHGHLPNIPSAKDMETHGVELGLMNMKLLEKIEELTLYVLQQEKRIKKLEAILHKNK